MTSHAFLALLQDAEPARSGFTWRDILAQAPMWAIIIVLFYFILIRPQRRQQKAREAMLSRLKKNDHVMTSSGILGIVDKVDEKEVVLKIDERSDVRVRMLRSAIADIVKVSGAAEAK